MPRKLYSVLAAVLAIAAPSFGQEAGTAQFAQPPTSPCSTCLSAPPNTIFLDASGGKLMHPLPSSQRAFANASEFATFIQNNLNATPVYDSAAPTAAGLVGSQRRGWAELSGEQQSVARRSPGSGRRSSAWLDIPGSNNCRCAGVLGFSKGYGRRFARAQRLAERETLYDDAHASTQRTHDLAAGGHE